MCHECAASPAAARLACSAECATALVQDDKAIHRLLSKSAQNFRASAFYCYLTGGLSAAAAIGAWFMLPSPFLILFTGGCAMVLFASGIWYTLVSRR
jgi:hypothetical protein